MVSHFILHLCLIIKQGSEDTQKQKLKSHYILSLPVNFNGFLQFVYIHLG